MPVSYPTLARMQPKNFFYFPLASLAFRGYNMVRLRGGWPQPCNFFREIFSRKLFPANLAGKIFPPAVLAATSLSLYVKNVKRFLNLLEF
jgi:hypothetical protein